MNETVLGLPYRAFVGGAGTALSLVFLTRSSTSFVQTRRWLTAPRRNASPVAACTDINSWWNKHCTPSFTCTHTHTHEGHGSE